MRNRAPKKQIAVVCILLILGFLTHAGLAEADEALRVRLARIGSQSEVAFCISGGYQLSNHEQQALPQGEEITAVLKDGGICVSFGNTSIDCGKEAALVRTSADGNIRFSSPKLANLYCGSLQLAVEGGALLPIVTIDVEDYVQGVLSAADQPKAEEALKAYAIAVRSRALAEKAKNAGGAYDLTDDLDGQVYRGFASENAHMLQAVEATRGMVLTSNGAPAQIVCTESNGGQIESAENAWGEVIPYLTAREDAYDLSSAAPGKSASLRKDGSDMRTELKTYLVKCIEPQLGEWGLSASDADVKIIQINSIEPVDPAYPGESRAYRMLRFSMDVFSASVSSGKPVRGTVAAEVPVHDVFAALYGLSVSSAENETVSVQDAGDSFRVVLRRSGSGVGMSLCGAQAMAADHGMQCAEILAYYFPGTQLGTLNTGASAARADDDELYVLPTIPPAPGEAEILPGLRAPEATDAPEGALLPIYTPEPEGQSVVTDDALPQEDAIKVQWADSDEAKPASEEDIVDDADFDLDEDFDFDEDFDLDEDFSFDEEFDLDAEFSLDEELDIDEEFNLDEDFDIDEEFSLDEEFDIDEEFNFDADSERIEPFDLIEDDAADEKSGEDTPAPSESDQQQPVSGEIYLYVNVNSSSKLMLRDAPSEDGKKIGKLRRGDRVRVLEKGQTWAHVETDSGTQGYASLDYLTEKKPSAGSSAWEAFRKRDSVKVCDATGKARVNVHMRAEASAEAKIVTKILGGDQVKVLGYDKKWAYVEYRGKSGFVDKKYLKISE